MKQQTALDILKLGCNVFLTGPAGSGKTFLLNQYIKYLKRKNIGVAVTASTGIAATHLNGQTIHSWSGLRRINKVQPRVTKIDLSAHGNPQGFVEELQRRYPDGNVDLSLSGTDLLVKIQPDVPTHIQISALEFIQDRVKEALHC